ncbi:tmk Thymidylate kinase [Methylophilaceae bacterium]
MFCKKSATNSVNLNNVIAVVGCDGSGKSTLTNDLIAELAKKKQIEWVYLGQSSGNIVDWIRSLPLIGPAFGRYLVRKAELAHSKVSRQPDTLTAIVIFLLSLWRVHKFRRVLKLANRGVLVITDRYPQAEVPGFYFDGTGLNDNNAQTWLARQLLKGEKRLYTWMASHRPTLLIRLNIDAETAHARKPDHKLAMLREKVMVIPTLQFNGATILDLNGRDPYPQVLAAALTAINSACAL